MTAVLSDAQNAQIRAADPAQSTWVSANAGSGKTRVLTDRVARLLLRGTDPQKILCLTYTKAAAAEMQNRLFARLGQWAMMPDEALINTLHTLGETDVRLSASALRSARTLFASALETPGGLKIQTIHSFCDSVLRRFPLEAGVSPQFKVLEDRQSRLLRREILEDLADTGAPEVLDELAAFLTSDDPDSLLSEIVQARGNFAKDVTPGLFGLTGSETLVQIAADIFDDATTELLSAWIPILKDSGANDRKLATRLLTAIGNCDPSDKLKALEAGLLFGVSAAAGPFTAKAGKVPTKSIRQAHPALADVLDRLMLRVEAARAQRINLNAFQKSRALYRFTREFLQEYDARQTGFRAARLF